MTESRERWRSGGLTACVEFFVSLDFPVMKIGASAA